jgi:hypothetical protein
MGMAVVAKFTDPRQAETAAGALRLAGYEAEVYDYPAGGDLPARLLGDYRLAVREDQSENALNLLREIHDDAPVHEPSEPPEPSVWAPSVVITPPPGAEPAWLALKRRSSLLSELAGVALIPIIILGGLAVVIFAARALWNLIYYGSIF